MQKIEIIDKDILNPRLTVTKTRITMKFPIGFDKAEKDYLTIKFTRVAEVIGEPEHSLRSSILNNMLTMRDDNGKILFTFNLDSV